MLTRHLPTLSIGLLAALLYASVASCQTPPQSLGAAVTTAVSLSPEQVAQVEAYVKWYADVLNNSSSTPSEVERARERLSQPFTQPNSTRMLTPNFRGTYSSAAVPAMEAAVKGKDIHRAINAIMVLALIGTDRASNVLTDHADITVQPVWQIRLQAANGERILLQSGLLDGRKVKDAANRLRDAAGREDNGLVLRHIFAALIAADASSLPPADRTAVRMTLASAVAAAARATAADPAVSQPDVVALASAIADLRNRYIAEYAADQASVGATLGPALGALLDWSRAHWDAVRSNPELTKDMGILINASEGLLQRIDAVVAGNQRQPPSSDMNGAWRAGDKQKFEAGVKAWQDVLGKSPYSS